MPITVLSPHSGRPVKIRDQDIQRAVRDEENRIFYVLQDTSGDYYAALTRKGGEKDLTRYRALEAKTGTAAEVVQEQQAAALNRTGKSKMGRKIFIYLVLLMLGALVALLAFELDMLPGLLKPAEDAAPPPALSMQLAPADAYIGHTSHAVSPLTA